MKFNNKPTLQCIKLSKHMMWHNLHIHLIQLTLWENTSPLCKINKVQ